MALKSNEYFDEWKYSSINIPIYSNILIFATIWERGPLGVTGVGRRGAGLAVCCLAPTQSQPATLAGSGIGAGTLSMRMTAARFWQRFIRRRTRLVPIHDIPKGSPQIRAQGQKDVVEQWHQSFYGRAAGLPQGGAPWGKMLSQREGRYWDRERGQQGQGGGVDVIQALQGRRVGRGKDKQGAGGAPPAWAEQTHTNMMWHQ